MTQTMLEMRNIKKTYGHGKKKTEALKNISLSLDSGEVCGFIGRNGAGKSSTIRILTGLSKPTSGEALLFGQSPTNPLIRKDLGYCPENPYLLDSLTPLEWMKISGNLRNLSGKELFRHCSSLLERLDIAHVANKPIRHFSKGMTQRVALANTLVGNPKLLILDEPLSGLDPVGRHTVITLLREYAADGGSIFFSSHILSDVAKLAGRMILIDKGTIFNTPDTLQQQHSRRFELTYNSNNKIHESAEKLGNDTWRITLGIEALGLAITKIHQQHATVIDLQARQPELDEVFVELLSQSEETSK